ncbi:MAG TPA: arsenate reductase ArsC, partial [Candidatus Binatia bacterium]
REIHPLAIQVMKEVGIDISVQRSKGLEEIPLDNVDLLITLCGDAAETCPTLPAKIDRRHWALRDPALARGTPKQILEIFRDVRDQIRANVEALLAGDDSVGEAANGANRLHVFTAMR